MSTDAKLQAAFKLFDKDGSGFLSPKEIKEILSFGGNLPDKVIENVLKDADENKDGEISYDEFVILMRKIGE